MRRRRQRKAIETTQNLDSFLDILTNTVGVLMFIGLFVTLVTAEAGTIIRTPLVSNSRKIPQFFEVRGNRVTRLDTQAVVLQVSTFINTLPNCEEPDISNSASPSLYRYYLDRLTEYESCLNNRIAKLENYRAEIPHYNVRVYIDSASSDLVYAYEPNPTMPGELPQEVTQKDSDFRTAMEKLNPQQDFIAFLVRPDSFEAFRAARQSAWSEGFEVGWEPMNPDREIIFGSSGRSVGVQ